jgi:hypothetical protein
MKRRILILGGMAAVTLALIAPGGASAATIFVASDEDSNSTGDTGCGLREAVQAANNNAPFNDCNGDAAGADTIVLQSGHTYALTNFCFPGRPVAPVEDANAAGDLDITGTTTITTDGAAPATITGNVDCLPADRDRVMQVFASSGGLTLENLHVQSGLVQASGGAAVLGGGGILSDAPLTITNSEIRGNRVQVNNASTQGGGIYVRGPQGAPLRHGTLAMTGSTVVDNGGRVQGAVGSGIQTIGGGIFAYHGVSSVSITNSTISGNSAIGDTGVGPGLVGGIFLGDGTMGNDVPAILTNNTITQNTATEGGAITGGLQVVNGTMSGNIVAGNTADFAPQDCSGDPATSLGANVLGIGDDHPAACSSTRLDAPGDLVGTTASPVNPVLGGLLPNGGSTLTHALNPGSPAINRGGSCPVTDQRGFFRAPVAPCDSGAFELNAPASLPPLPPPAASTPLPPPPATVTPLQTGLRAAAIKKCKKKFPKGPKRKKCIRKAKRLPV